ncbi:MAG TPA: T9SS type A sorting domain-containing protein [Bacteroidetes bacterium]|nr:T9SS type A sorting domain-containing protein [Bacteroidota bacterium]
MITKATITRTGGPSTSKPYFFALSGTNIALPVELFDFRAIAQDDNTALLTWQTASEQGNKGFEIEKSTDGRNWETQGFVPGHGTTSEFQQYKFIDEKPLSPHLGGCKGGCLNYYRLRQMDFDGKFEYSEVRSVLFEDGPPTIFQAYPNPVDNGQLTLYFSGELNETSTLRLFSSAGQLLRQEKITSPLHPLEMGGLAAGIYWLEVVSGQRAERQQVVVQ